MEFDISRYGQDELSWSVCMEWEVFSDAHCWDYLCQSKWAMSYTILMKQHWVNVKYSFSSRSVYDSLRKSDWQSSFWQWTESQNMLGEIQIFWQTEDPFTEYKMWWQYYGSCCQMLFWWLVLAVWVMSYTE